MLVTFRDETVIFAANGWFGVSGLETSRLCVMQRCVILGLSGRHVCFIGLPSTLGLWRGHQRDLPSCVLRLCAYAYACCACVLYLRKVCVYLRKIAIL